MCEGPAWRVYTYSSGSISQVSRLVDNNITKQNMIELLL
jgi:hypothetical protein